MDDETVEKLKSILNNGNIPNDFKDILSNLGNNNSENTSDSTNNDTKNNTNIDFETIMKLKSVMDKINSKDDPRAKLLISLKPYLKESRKNKIDQYIQFLNMSNVLNIFSNGDNKK